MKNTILTTRRILEALGSTRCRVFHGALARTTENSTVQSFPVLRFSELVSRALGSIGPETMEVGFHLVTVTAPRPEDLPLHYHISSVVGFVAKGEGRLYHEAGRKKRRERISTGDVFVFPKGVKHILATDEGNECLCVTFEFGPHLDYQAHHQ